MIRSVLLFAVLLSGSLAPSTVFASAAAHPVLPEQGAIASANKLATTAGIEILKAGGNAFDAAIAVSAVLSVVEPESSGLGGGAFVLLGRADGSYVFVDARETAPSAASRDMYLDKSGEPVRELAVNGAKAAAIPGLAAAWVHVAKSYGRLPLARVLKPAIQFAGKGFPWGAKNSAMQGFRVETLRRFPASAKQFLVNGEPRQIGSVLRQPDLAKTLKLIADKGHSAFYRGAFAARLVAGVRAEGGLWSEQDLANYKVVERPALQFAYRNWQVITSPPPSSGGVALAEMFNILSAYQLDSMPRVAKLHLTFEAMRRAYRDRAIYLGDPDFVKVPLDLLLSSHYAAGLRASINPDVATPSAALAGISAQSKGTDTTHFSIVDREGNLVAWTQTVNLPFGSGLVIPGTGFLLNNEMDDFSVKPGVPNAFGLVGDDANAIAPGKRPLSSMTPTFLLGGDRVAVLGTPGGSRIITMVFNALLGLMDGADASSVTAAPRLHHQYLPDVISAEPNALNAEEVSALTARGFVISADERTWGNMQLVVWDKRTGRTTASSDPRWEKVGGAGVYR